jgi:hypothetical protein
VFVLADEFVVFGAGFVGDGSGHLVLHVFVPGCREADGLGVDGGEAGAGDTVEALVPPVVGGDMEAGDRRCGVHHLAYLFIEGHVANEVIYTLVDGEVRVKVRGDGVGIRILLPVAGIVEQEDGE